MEVMVENAVGGNVEIVKVRVRVALHVSPSIASIAL